MFSTNQIQNVDGTTIERYGCDKMSKENKVWLYCRIAQFDVDAMLRQENILRASADEHHEIVGVTREYGAGMDIDRPGLKEVQERAREGVMGRIWVIREDRICRNYLLAQRWIQDTILFGVSVGTLRGNDRLTNLITPKIERVAVYIRFGNETQMLL